MNKVRIRMLLVWPVGFVVFGLILAGYSIWLALLVGALLLGSVFTLIRGR